MKKRCAHIIVALSLLLQSFPANALSIAMVVWRGQTEAETGFIEKLKQQGYELDVTFYDAAQDRKKLSSLIRGELTDNLDKYDYIYTFGTTVSKAVKLHLNGRVPHIFNIVSFPADTGILPSEQGGQHNTAGVSSRVLTEVQITNAKNIINLQKVVVAFNPREENSTLQLEKMVEIGKKNNFSIVPLRIRPDKKLFMSDLRRLEQHLPISAIYLPSDSFLISNAQQIIDFINDKNIPSICAVSAYMKNGCLVGTVASYSKLGALAASIVTQHQQGTPLSSIPVQFDNSSSPTINEDLYPLLEEQIVLNPE